MSRREVEALAKSSGGWGEVASADMTRYSKPNPNLGRRRCPFGCKTRATHTGYANGLALTSGCEFHMAWWARDGYEPLLAAMSAPASAVSPEETPDA